MEHIDGFRTTDSFRFDRSTSTISLSSSSGYGSRLSLSSLNRSKFLSKYFKEKLSRHKSLASLLFSTPKIEQSQQEIYDTAWNLDEQIDKIRLNLSSDCQSIISMSVDEPERIHLHTDKDLLSAAAWYQAGLPRHICEEYLTDDKQPIGSFILRHSFTQPEYPYVLSIKTKSSFVEHVLIERIHNNHNAYRLQVRVHYSHISFDDFVHLELFKTI